MAGDTPTQDAAAAAAGAPLSEPARLLMRHEETLEIDAPRWLADRAVCASRGWGVATGVGAAWLLAEGTQRLLTAERADRHLTDRLCAGLAGGDGHKNRRKVRVHTPRGTLRVALGLLAMRTGTGRQDIATIALAWGALRLHSTRDGHDCAPVAPSGTPAQAATPATDPAPVCPHTAAVQTAIPLTPQALALLAPNQTVPMSLPAWLDDWLECIARRWHTPASTMAVWLLAEGAAHLYTLEARRDTAWRNGPTRWVIPTSGTAGPRRLIESPSESLRTLLGRLASRCGASRTDIVALAAAVGAKDWQDNCGCGCGPRHTPATRRR